MPAYSKGKIYTIRYRGDDSLVYVGSTIQSLAARMGGHRQDCNKQCKNSLLYMKMRETNDMDNWSIELFELYPCNSKEELLKREGEVIREISSLNKQIAGRKKEQWREENRKQLLEKKKQYYENNKDIILDKQKAFYEENKDKIKLKRYVKVQCECGGHYSNWNKIRHLKSPKHQNYINGQNQN